MNGTDGLESGSVRSVGASSGVEVLIQRLRQQGVAAGNTARNEITSKAEQEAARILKEARDQADNLVENAREEADRLRKAGEDALRIAGRDSVLRMRETVTTYFEDRVKRLASTELEDPEFLRKLIIEVAKRVRDEAAVDEAEEIEVLLPQEVVGTKELRDNPEELEGTLSEYAKAIASATWREGVVVKTLEVGGRGIRVRLLDDDLEIDLTDEAIAELLLEHLQPRFRAVLTGMIGE
jgi:V/A-type H+/Na+-transporting ATPase subunit E